MEAAAYCVTELVANVHEHVDPPECELTLRNLPDGVRLSVSDRSNSRPVAVEGAELWVESGRGVLLVGALAERWGTEATETGKEVWAVLREVAG